jgi:hypothetical protein
VRTTIYDWLELLLVLVVVRLVLVCREYGSLTLPRRAHEGCCWSWVCTIPQLLRHPLTHAVRRFDTIKTRLQCAPGAYKGAWDCLRQTIRNEVCVCYVRYLSSSEVYCSPFSRSTKGLCHQPWACVNQYIFSLGSTDDYLLVVHNRWCFTRFPTQLQDCSGQHGHDRGALGRFSGGLVKRGHALDDSGTWYRRPLRWTDKRVRRYASRASQSKTATPDATGGCRSAVQGRVRLRESDCSRTRPARAVDRPLWKPRVSEQLFLDVFECGGEELGLWCRYTLIISCAGSDAVVYEAPGDTL